MKRLAAITLLVSLLIITLLGCITTPTPKGTIFTNCKGPLYGTSNENFSKVGKASAYSIIWMIAWGDASVNTAAKKAGIVKIHHVDYEDFVIFAGIYAEYTVFVYGE